MAITQKVGHDKKIGDDDTNRHNNDNIISKFQLIWRYVSRVLHIGKKLHKYPHATNKSL